MLECPRCGHENAVASNFCNRCGAPLSGPGDTTGLIPVVLDEHAASDLSQSDVTTIDSLPGGSAVLVVRGDGGRFLLNRPTTIAGRHVNADIFLDDITVSRHHARFDLLDGEVTVQDLGSLNGTYVNRRRIEQPRVLQDGDEVQVGKFRMVVYLGGRS